MKIYSLDVRKDIIEPKNIVVPSGNAKLHQLKFVFDEAWDGLPKVCVFTRDGKEYSVALEDDACVIPSDMAMDAGAFEFGVYGYDADGEELVIRISTNKLNGLIVDGAYTGTDDEVTPTLYEQLGAALERHKNDDSNPHKVSAKQVGVYSKEEIDQKNAEKTNLVDFEKHIKNTDFLHPYATASGKTEDFDLTKTARCEDKDLSNVKITKDTLQGAANTFIVDFKGEADVEIYADSFVYVNINGNTEYVEYQDTFQYSGDIKSFTVYVSAGSAVFKKFTMYSLVGEAGFMSSVDKKKLDALPDNAYSKSDADNRYLKIGEPFKFSEVGILTADVLSATINAESMTVNVPDGVTFTSSPSIPTIRNYDNDDRAANKGYVDGLTAPLKESISVIATRTDALEIEIGNIDTRLDDLEKSVGTVNTRVDELEENLGDIDTALDTILSIQSTLLGGETA